MADTHRDPPPTGRIDIHSHLIPDVDDGCRNLDDVLTSVRALRDAGFVGSICTPHIWDELYPQNTAENVRQWTARLQAQLDEHGLDYQLWPGGEVRLYRRVLDWFKHHEIPTLAGSRFVLIDMWEDVWPKWADPAIDWLLEHDYRPILAHPERMAAPDLPDRLDSLVQRGVLLQGNYRCMTGEDGYLPDQWVRRFLAEDRYDLLALDAHRPDTLESRLDGIQLVAQEFGPDRIEHLTVQAPRDLIFADITRPAR